MNMDWNAILTPALGFLAMGMVGAIVILFKGVASRYNAQADAKIEQIENAKTRQLIWDTKQRVFELVIDTVTSLEQTTVQGIKDAIADNKSDKSELIGLGQVAVDKVYGQLKESAKAILAEEVVDVQAYIMDKVQTAVFNLPSSILRVTATE